MTVNKDYSNFKFEWLAKDEQILYITKQHWIVFVPYLAMAAVTVWLCWSILFTGFGIALAVVGAIIISPVFVKYTSTMAIVTNKRVVCKSGIADRVTEMIMIDQIEHIAVLKDALGLGIVDLGSVRVASGTPSVTLAQVNNVTELAKQINQQIERIKK